MFSSAIIFHLYPVKETAVVILNWNGRKLLERFLPTVLRHTPTALADVVVADNASTDDSVQFLQTHFPSVRLIINEKNYGFAEGYNQALSNIQARYFLLLNSDVEVTAGWLDPLYTFLESNKQYASVQPKVLAWSDKSKFEYAGASGGYMDALAYPFCRGRIFDFCEIDNHQYDTVTNIFWASGACMLIRADIFREAGGFDADFFAHMEEIDLCWRIQNKGNRIACIPGSVVYHVGGASLQAGNPFKVYLNFRNNLFMILKNTTFPYVLPLLYLRMILDGIAGIQFLLGGKFDSFFSVLKAHFHFYTSIPKLLAKRKTIVKRKLDMTNGVYSGSIVWDYFVRAHKTFSSLLTA